MDYKELMIKDLQDLYQAETEQASQLPQLAARASSELLRTALEEHAAETQQQVLRLRQILEMVGETPGGQGEVTPGVLGLVSERQKKGDLIQDPALKDLALIAAAQKMEHYEIAMVPPVRWRAQRAWMTRRAFCKLLLTKRKPPISDLRTSRSHS